jgi:hypothetical protein
LRTRPNNTKFHRALWLRMVENDSFFGDSVTPI